MTPREFRNLQRNLAELLRLVVAGITDDQFAERLEHCLAHDDAAVHVTIDREAGRFSVVWGGATLVQADLETLWADELKIEALPPLVEIPNDVGAMFGGQL